MGRLTLIILVLFSVTAIYSEANAAAETAADTGKTLYEHAQGIPASH